ncbi:MAG: sugar phosphate isomerase/epimerase, partial [Anaerolineae bacterium]|nr:sugar phosphate isomerase/epimerase [Anaerolineae bacterium]
GARLFHVHFADSNRWYPGAGHIDFGHIVQTLKAMDYQGYISIEAMPLPDADTCAKEAVKMLKRLLS